MPTRDSEWIDGIELLFSDPWLLVVNKPARVLSVPGRGDHKKDCVISRLQSGGFENARIVHRLDWETTGLMVVARNPEIHRHLSIQFQDRKIYKEYTALCEGVFHIDQGEVNQPLIYDAINKPRHKVCEKGKASQTQWQVLEQHPDCARMCLKPITGRSHQLRVHMQWLGHPIVGDTLYSTHVENHDRLCLHASRLKFVHPYWNAQMDFQNPTPF